MLGPTVSQAPHVPDANVTKNMVPQRLLAALALISAVEPACGCGKSMGLCGGGSCPNGQFCNFANNRVQRRTSPSCEMCGGGGTHNSDGSRAVPCECGLPVRGQTECSNKCLDAGPKLGTDGCCCSTFAGVEVQSTSDCAARGMCADTDVACCVHVFSGDGTCNEQEVCYCDDGSPATASGSCPNSTVCDNVPRNANERCVAGLGTAGSLSPGWDRDCNPGPGGSSVSAQSAMLQYYCL